MDPVSPSKALHLHSKTRAPPPCAAHTALRPAARSSSSKAFLRRSPTRARLTSLPAAPDSPDCWAGGTSRASLQPNSPSQRNTQRAAALAAERCDAAKRLDYRRKKKPLKTIRPIRKHWGRAYRETGWCIYRSVHLLSVSTGE